MKGLNLVQTAVEITSDGIATVWLNRPDRGNAFTGVMADELDLVFRVADVDPSVKVVILAGRGKNFCVGADLNADPSGLDQSRDLGGVASLSIFHCRKPVIAALHGACVGIGITMVLPCDLRYADEDAKVGFIFANRGLSVEAASSFFLPRLVGMGRATEWCLTARKFFAREESFSGLFSGVVPKGQAYTKAFETARQMIEQSSLVSLAYIKRCLWAGATDMKHPHEAHELESKVLTRCFTSAEVAEGFSSFLEKRPPKFPGLATDADPNLDAWANWRLPYPQRKSKL